MKSGLSQSKIAPREGPGVNCCFLDKPALLWTNSATSGAAICALMRARQRTSTSVWIRGPIEGRQSDSSAIAPDPRRGSAVCTGPSCEKKEKKKNIFKEIKIFSFFVFFFSLADLMLTLALTKALSHCKP